MSLLCTYCSLSIALCDGSKVKWTKSRLHIHGQGAHTYLNFPSPLRYLPRSFRVNLPCRVLVFVFDILSCPFLFARRHVMSVLCPKVLLFSNHTRVLELIEVTLQEEQLPYLRLDGATPLKQRVKLVQRFNSDPNIFVFLLSTKAAGLGGLSETRIHALLHRVAYVEKT